MKIKDAVAECFPDVADGLLAMARTRSEADTRITDMGVARPVDILERIGKDADGIARFSGIMADGHGLAMEYMGPYGRRPGYSGLYGGYDVRPYMNIVLLTDRNGNPTGMVPFGCERTNTEWVYRELGGCGCTIVTDRVRYTDLNRLGLDLSGEEYLIVLPPFPVSFSSSRNAQMQELKHNGKVLSACKVRYDKRWLFRFTDPEEAERIKGWMDNEDIHRNDRDVVRLSAGSTDVISNTGFDIREVRRLLDIRERTDLMMVRHRDLLANEIGAVDSEDAVMGYMFMSVLSMMMDKAAL